MLDFYKHDRSNDVTREASNITHSNISLLHNPSHAALTHGSSPFIIERQSRNDPHTLYPKHKTEYL